MDGSESCRRSNVGVRKEMRFITAVRGHVSSTRWKENPKLQTCTQIMRPLVKKKGPTENLHTTRWVPRVRGASTCSFVWGLKRVAPPPPSPGTRENENCIFPVGSYQEFLPPALVRLPWVNKNHAYPRYLKCRGSARDSFQPTATRPNIPSFL